VSIDRIIIGGNKLQVLYSIIDIVKNETAIIIIEKVKKENGNPPKT